MAKHKKFKPHMMYCKDGSTKEAKTFKDHLKFKKEGCGHKKPKGDDKVMKMDPYRDVDPSPVKDGKKVARKRAGSESPEKES